VADRKKWSPLADLFGASRVTHTKVLQQRIIIVVMKMPKMTMVV